MLAALAAEVASVAALLCATWDLETIGLAMVTPAALIPGLALYLATISYPSLAPWRGLLYFLPPTSITLVMAFIWLKGGEGAGFAGYIALTVAVAAIACYASLSMTDSRRTTT
jgi:hypothetical protein